ncbi:MAG: hypothetical protein ACRD8Z_21800 [Nitrososphaeraceae archaeon]
MLNQEKVPTKSVVYDSSIDALHDLLSSCQITEISTSLSHLTNGIEYTFVEISCSDGIQYGLQAYGQEALELNRVAIENLPKK